MECYRPKKVTGVCSLLNAYSGTQSGKPLGGKLAEKKNLIVFNVPGKGCKQDETI
jgi:hypothetical protein